ncbi:DUF2399 domain-containing protein [Nocardioides sp. URHA0032]|uniref:DUF2399 domain-containing protein n=1 Tax=Nocardioides sp. URHA0032 TaxID=1380388 RepID=UPI003FA53FCB
MRRRTSAKGCRSPLIRYHGDFDWPGVAIAGRMLAAGAAHRAPGLGCGAATPTQGCPATQRPRRSVHHPQRPLALPHRRPGPAVAYPPARRLCRPRRPPGCVTPPVPPNGGNRDRRGLRRRGRHEPARPHIQGGHRAALHRSTARRARLPGRHRPTCSSGRPNRASEASQTEPENSK